MEGVAEAEANLQAVLELAAQLAPLMKQQQADGGSTSVMVLAGGVLIGAFVLCLRYAQRMVAPLNEAVKTLHSIQEAQRLQSLASAKLLEVLLSIDLPAMGVDDELRERLRQSLRGLVDQMSRSPLDRSGVGSFGLERLT